MRETQRNHILIRSRLHGQRGKYSVDLPTAGKCVISERSIDEREEGIVEQMIIPSAFRGNFQQPLAPPIESATVPETTLQAMRGYPACHIRNLHEREAPGIAEDRDSQDGCYNVRRGDLCTIFRKFS